MQNLEQLLLQFQVKVLLGCTYFSPFLLSVFLYFYRNKFHSQQLLLQSYLSRLYGNISYDNSYVKEAYVRLVHTTKQKFGGLFLNSSFNINYNPRLSVLIQSEVAYNLRDRLTALTNLFT